MATVESLTSKRITSLQTTTVLTTKLTQTPDRDLLFNHQADRAQSYPTLYVPIYPKKVIGTRLNQEKLFTIIAWTFLKCDEISFVAFLR